MSLRDQLLTADTPAEIADVIDQYVRNEIVRIQTNPTTGATELLGPDGRAIKTQKVGNGVVVFGDSRARMSDPSVSDNDRGMWKWANILMGQRFNTLAVSGVSGDTAALMLARIEADVLDHEPDYVVVLVGINDISAGVATATIISNLQSIYSKINAIGATVVACLEYPSSSAYSTTAKREALMQLNHAILDYARTHSNVVVANLYDALIDPTSATGAQKTGTLHDNIHPSVAGARLCATEISNVMTTLCPAQRIFSTSKIDVVSATHQGGNLVLNGCMAGTAGTNTGTGMSGNVADSWFNFLESGTATSVSSKVARTDNYSGEWNRQTIAATADNSIIRLRQTVTLPAQVAVGDTIEAYCELALSSVVGVVDSVHFVIYLMDAGFTNTLAAWSIEPSGDPATAFSGVLKIDPVVIPANTTQMFVMVRCQLDNGASCVVDVGRVEVRKVA